MKNLIFQRCKVIKEWITQNSNTVLRNLFVHNIEFTKQIRLEMANNAK